MVPSNEIFYLEKAKVADYFFVTFTENSLVVYLEVCSVREVKGFWTFGIEVKTIMKENRKKDGVLTSNVCIAVVISATMY